MRSGLLAVGVILLILGAIFYFIPGDTTTETATVDTDVAQTYDSTQVLENGTDNETDTTSGWMSNRTAGTTTTDRTTVSDTAGRVDVADTGDETIGNPDKVVYVYTDDDGAMYTPGGEYLGAGISTAADRGTVGDTTTATTDRITVSDTERQQVADQDVAIADDVYGIDNEASVVSDDDSDNSTLAGTATAASGGNVLRTLAILAMVLGAILTILGLVLPSHHVDIDVDRSARTHGTAGRRVYEREEVRRDERRR